MSSSTDLADPVLASAKPMPTGVVRRGPRSVLPLQPKKPVSREAQRFAATILEVLAGVRTPTDAAKALGVPVPRYYLWEQRALAGLVAACEPRPPGKAASQRHQIAVLQKEVAQLTQECARQQALARAAQRTLGLGPPVSAKPAGKSVSPTVGKAAAGKKTRKRRPTVRALKAVAGLRTAATAEETAADPSSADAAEVLQPSAVTNLSMPPMPAQVAPTVAET